MADLIIKIKCGRCNGTGINDNQIVDGIVVSESCTSCSGTGYFGSGLIDATEITDLLNDIKDKCNDIFEKVSE